jgi:hypothetical protein
MSKNFLIQRLVYQACRGWKEFSIGGSAIFVGGRWAELGCVKNWAKSLHKWNHPIFFFFLNTLLQKSPRIKTWHPAFEKYDIYLQNEILLSFLRCR